MNTLRVWATGWLAALFISVSVQAGYVPETIQYEGTVLNEFGQPGSGTRSFMFTLYDTDNLLRWVEEQADVPLNQQGAFQVLLGKSKTLPAIAPSWRLTVWMKAGDSSWKEVTPPQAMTAVFYALQADDARRVPNDLVVRQDLRVAGDLNMMAPVLATSLNVEEASIGSISSSQLTVSDLSGPTNRPISISGELEITQGLVLKGSVSMMKVANLTSATLQNASGRCYLLAILNDNANLGHIAVQAADSGKRDIYFSNMSNGNYFLPLDLNSGYSIIFSDKNGVEIPMYSYVFGEMFRTLKLIQMRQ